MRTCLAVVLLMAACDLGTEPTSLETMEGCTMHLFFDSLTLALDSARLERCDYSPIDGTIILPDGTIVKPSQHHP